MTDLVLVHGGLHDGWCWQLVRRELEARGHRTWAPDLPADDPDAGAEACADAVLAAIGDAGPEAVVVGHSLGGLTIPLVATRRPVGGLIFLCAAVPDVGRSYADQVAEVEDRPGPERTIDGNGRMWLAPEVATFAFYHDCPADLAEAAVRRLRPQSMRPLVEVTPLEAWPPVPTRVVSAADDRLVAGSYSTDVAANRLGCALVEIPGGHSPFLARPAELADLLLRLCDEMLDEPPGPVTRRT